MIFQYLPAAFVYGLNAMGIKGKHNFKDRTIILGTSYLLMSATVLSLKYTTKVERPDGTANAFPSGHTATALLVQSSFGRNTKMFQYGMAFRDI